MSFLLGSAVMIVLAALSHIPALSAALTGAGLELFADIPFFTGYTLSALPVVLYTFIGVTGLGYTCYFLTMEVASTHEASLVFFFKPALAPVLAWLILREQIAGNMVAGIVLILAGSLLSLLPWLRSLAQGRKERALEEQK
jgi:drug/metabolite transporter (DMT)-like permease